jgi:hypothetical protein
LESPVFFGIVVQLAALPLLFLETAFPDSVATGQLYQYQIGWTLIDAHQSRADSLCSSPIQHELLPTKSVIHTLIRSLVYQEKESRIMEARWLFGPAIPITPA